MFPESAGDRTKSSNTSMTLIVIVMASILAAGVTPAQSKHAKTYSESTSIVEKPVAAKNEPSKKPSEDVVRIETDLVTVPVRIFSKDGRPGGGFKQEEFKIYENGVEQPIAYFADEDHPFTVALLLDMSYSTVFKLRDIQAAADLFVSQLRGDDRVMIIAFDEEVRMLCGPTSNREALRLAIAATSIGSGTSVYDALDAALNEHLRKIDGRKAIVLLTDGVDTRSRKASAQTIVQNLGESEELVFPVQYDTFGDVQRNRQKDAPIAYDKDDRPYTAQNAPSKGEREEDYSAASDFLNNLANETGGRVYKAGSNTKLNQAFANIAEELRKTYSVGYYPSELHKPGETYSIKVRVYRPGLIVRAREKFLGVQKAARGPN
jgi:VWFA-related protein